MNAPYDSTTIKKRDLKMLYITILAAGGALLYATVKEVMAMMSGTC